MNSLYTRPIPQSMRFIPSRRRVKNGDANYLTKSIVTNEWDHIGVTNLCFRDDDESYDVTGETGTMNNNSLPRQRLYSTLSHDSGYGDAMTSPEYVKSQHDVNAGIYHRAMSRRKSLAEIGSENCRSSPPSSGSIGEAECISQNKNDLARRESVQDDVFPDVTSSNNHVERGCRQLRSASLSETKQRRQLIVQKPRSNSQPNTKEIPGLSYCKLEDINEEEVSIDKRGISRLIKRRAFSANSAGKGYPGDSIKTTLLRDNNLNDWQVKLGEKEPEKCRCDDKKPPPPPAAPIPLPPPPKQPEEASPPTSSESYETVQYVTGNEVSIGESEAMSLSDSPDEIEGVVTEIGSSREMSSASTTELTTTASTTYSSSTGVSLDVPSASAGKRKKSIKNIFRLGFLTTKGRRKSKAENTIPSPDAGPLPPSPSKRMTQRRMSRLEMNEPIEDIFSGVTFETIQKRPVSATCEEKGEDDVDDDVIEDPEAIMRSIIREEILQEQDSFLSKQESHEEGHVTDDVILESHDVIDPANHENELLLPGAGKVNALSPICTEHSQKLEVDLR